MNRIISFVFFLFLTGEAFSQEKVTFSTKENLTITADLYVKDYNYPFVLMFHQSYSSRGEYNEIARKIYNLKYNCLAVDLRSGNSENFVINETVLDAKKKRISSASINAAIDIHASIEYIRKLTKKPIVLFGSGYSASLCLLEAQENSEVSAVIAFSPGEYFQPMVSIKDSLLDISKPVFIANSKHESKFVMSMTEKIPSEYLFLSDFNTGNGYYGAKALWAKAESSKQLWLDLLLFFKKLSEEE